VADNPEHWFEKQPSQIMILSAFDVILMRKDPPFDMNYSNTVRFSQVSEKLIAELGNDIMPKIFNATVN
jgi:glutathione synthase